MAKITENIRKYLLLILALVTVAIWVVYFQEPDRKLHIYFFDVGQGDSELIQKGDWQILIDGGPDNLITTRLSEVMPIEDRKIEEIIITHPHADHIAGLNEVLNRYEVGKIVLTNVDYESNTYKNLLKIIEEKNISTYEPKINDREYVFDQGKITYLWPGENLKNYQNNLNNTSIVFRFDYGNFSSLFTGDAEKETWKNIFSKNYLLLKNISVIKIPHHGSKTGLNFEQIVEIKPTVAVISVDKNNKYKLPDSEVIDSLVSTGTKVYRTDEDKTIEISTNGKDFRIE